MKKDSGNSPLRSGVIFLSIFVAVCTGAIIGLAKHESQRDYNNWKITLGVMTDTQANAINQWLDSQMAILLNLSRNPSLQLYSQQISQRQSANFQSEETEMAQVSYLRNLIFSTAERNGFFDQHQEVSPIKANVAFHAGRGLALYDQNQELITATPGISRPGNLLRVKIRDVLTSGKASVTGLTLNEDNVPIIGFLVPFQGLQRGSGATQENLGVIYGFKEAGDTIYPLLKSVGRVTKTDESLLVKVNQNAIIYLSPLADDTMPMQKQLDAKDPELASAYAANNPGAFNRLKDYSGSDVLFTSRTIADTGWILIRKINAKEALRESKTHQQFLTIVLALVTLLVAALIVAAWRHGSSIKEKNAAEELQRKTLELQAQNHLLDAINTNISDFILLCTKDAVCLFANQHLASEIPADPEELKGKTLSSIFGATPAGQLVSFINEALTGQKIRQRLTLFGNRPPHPSVTLHFRSHRLPYRRQ